MSCSCVELSLSLSADAQYPWHSGILGVSFDVTSSHRRSHAIEAIIHLDLLLLQSLNLIIAMKGSAVQVFRSLASKIHPPVALSQQESRRLLAALTSSFQKQLDLAHPAPSTGDNTGFKSFRSPSPKRTDRVESSADSHLVFVLTNPLIARSNIQNGSATSQRHPMQVFEDYVSRGIATPDIAKLCLAAFKGSLVGLTRERRQKEILGTRAGSSVLRWLWSTSFSTEDVFTHDMRLVTLLSEMLVSEGREEALWRWMAKVDTQITVSRPDKDPVEAHPQALLLRSIVASHVSLDADAGIKSALTSFIRMVDSCESPTFRTVKASRILRPAGLYLSRTLPNFIKAASSDGAFGTLFDHLIRSCSIWERSRSRAIYRSALLNAHHPINPSAAYTLELLQFLKRNPDDALIAQDSKHRPSLLRLLFDSIDILQAHKSYDDAAWVMEFMRIQFSGDLIGTHHERKLTVPEARRSRRESQSKDTFSSREILDWGASVPG